jgi:hypothetical protein
MHAYVRIDMCMCMHAYIHQSLYVRLPLPHADARVLCLCPLLCLCPCTVSVDVRVLCLYPPAACTVYSLCVRRPLPHLLLPLSPRQSWLHSGPPSPPSSAGRVRTVAAVGVAADAPRPHAQWGDTMGPRAERALAPSRPALTPTAGSIDPRDTIGPHHTIHPRVDAAAAAGSVRRAQGAHSACAEAARTAGAGGQPEGPRPGAAEAEAEARRDGWPLARVSPAPVPSGRVACVGGAATRAVVGDTEAARRGGAEGGGAGSDGAGFGGGLEGGGRGGHRGDGGAGETRACSGWDEYVMSGT